MESPYYNESNEYKMREYNDKFENGVLTTNGCFARHSLARNQQSLEWLSRQNELRLNSFDKEDGFSEILEELTGVIRSIDESILDYYERIKTELM